MTDTLAMWVGETKLGEEVKISKRWRGGGADMSKLSASMCCVMWMRAALSTAHTLYGAAATSPAKKPSDASSTAMEGRLADMPATQQGRTRWKGGLCVVTPTPLCSPLN